MPTQPPLWEKPLWFQCFLLAAVLLFIFGIVSVLASLLRDLDPHWLSVINALALFLLPALVYATLVYRHPLQEAGFTSASNAWFYPLGALIMLASLPLIQALVHWNTQIPLPAWMNSAQKAQDNAIDNLLTDMPTVRSLAINLLVMAFLPALGEEALFRGVFQKLLYRGSGNIHKAVFWSAVIFSALHFQFAGFFPRLVLGMILGYLFAYSGSLWPSILAHFVYNGTQVVYEYFKQHQPVGHPAPFFREDFPIPAVYTLISLVLVMAGLFLMKRLNPKQWP